ncbi:MAG TPA: DUF4258 domain-containing protein [Candidatus Kapabacteria bacterium]|nr:DUF4258 domain-containing protein [Candidatus Kapabacteria bacterium]
MEEFLESIRRAASKKILFTPHAILQMSRPSRMITPEEIRRVIEHGSIIEDYPEDVRGHSCLILGHGTGRRPIHVVCSPKFDYLGIITAYTPNREQWTEDFRKRM